MPDAKATQDKDDDQPEAPRDGQAAERGSAALYMDLGNALYGLMLCFLVPVSSMETRPAAQKKILLEAAFTLMHALSATASYLSRLRKIPADQ